MSDCSSIDTLVTPYIDGELGSGERAAVAEHIAVCGACRSRVAGEQAARDAVRSVRPFLQSERAPEPLRRRCSDLASRAPVQVLPQIKATVPADMVRPFSRSPRRAPAFVRAWSRRVAPAALAASLVMIVSGAFVYRLTEASTEVLAAELTADHVKCFALNRVLGTHETAATVESSLASGFGWLTHVPDPGRSDLELVGSRPCLYGNGKIAHVMYRHNGEPVSLFMLPNKASPQELVHVLGHEAAIWCIGNRTFVLVARGTRDEVERMAAVMRASLE